MKSNEKNNASSVIIFRITDDSKEKFKKACKENNKTISQVIKQLIESYYKK